MIKQTKNIYIVVEGSSEKSFFTRLNSFCRNIGIPKSFKIENAEGHQLKKVLAAVKKAGQKIKKDTQKMLTTNVIVFLDYDVFKRGEDIKPYIENLPQLYFFEYNFEDFLVSLLPKNKRKLWEQICNKNNHYNHPMSSTILERYIKEIFPNYKKGFCPLTEITQDNIKNMEETKFREEINHAGHFLLKHLSSDNI